MWIHGKKDEGGRGLEDGGHGERYEKYKRHERTEKKNQICIETKFISMVSANKSMQKRTPKMVASGKGGRVRASTRCVEGKSCG